MTLTAAPTFHRPEYYNSTHQSSYPQGNPPPYSEYDNQVRYLAQRPLNDSGYWENTRDEAVRMLNEQAGPYV